MISDFKRNVRAQDPFNDRVSDIYTVYTVQFSYEKQTDLIIQKRTDLKRETHQC